jgi:hypothetical protein
MYFTTASFLPTEKVKGSPVFHLNGPLFLRLF